MEILTYEATVTERMVLTAYVEYRSNARANHRICQYCPLAQAVRKRFPEARVYRGFWSITPMGAFFTLPVAAREFVLAFDAWCLSGRRAPKPVTPFSFTISFLKEAVPSECLSPAAV